MEKKNGGTHAAVHSRKGLAFCALALVTAAAAIFLLLNASGQLQDSRDAGSALLGDKLALERSNRETGAALAAQQEKAAQLEADLQSKQSDLAALQTQLAGLKASLEDSDVRETDLKGRLEALQAELLETQAELLETQTELSDLQVQCSSILRPSAEAILYQQLFPDLYVDAPETQTAAEDKVVYLTFDDGPSPVTDQILEVLDQYGIKATFFVVPNGTAESNARLRAIVEAGHALAIHTASHDYNKIYASVEAYLADFELAFRRVEEATGVRCDMFRFPGGSINGYNRGVYQAIIAEMLRRGFTYYDWNASNDDSAGQTTVSGIVNRAVETTKAKRAILLCHDAPAKTNTAKALPAIIEQLQQKGYRFDKLDNTVLPVTFTYK